MTVSEHLYACNLLDEWEKAIINRDEKLMKEILLETLLSKKQVDETVRMVLNNPEFYGYK